MKIKKNNKKGFTIVELVIVIAVIGILAAILIPTFISLNNKARMANTESFLKNINTQIAMKEADAGLDGEEVGSFETMASAVEYAKKKGFDLEEISPFAGNEIVWDEVNHRFAFVHDDGGDKYTTNYAEARFEMANAVFMPDSLSELEAKIQAGVKVYVKEKLGATGPYTVKNSFDAGNSKNINVTYVHGEQGKALIRTNGDQVLLTINAPDDDVNFFGFAKALNVKEVAQNSLHVYGSVGQLAVEVGHVEVESTGIVFDIVQVGNALTDDTTGVSITNNGYVANVSLSQHVEARVAEALKDIASPTEEQKAAAQAAAQAAVDNKKAEVQNAAVSGSSTVGGDLQIDSLAHLEAFRDAVNSGNDFFGKKVFLNKNITLNDGWTPIGEGYRDIAATNTSAAGLSTFFRGEFNGNGHTISNLNNIGFTPSDRRIVQDGERTYAYGLFALVGDSANIHDLVLDKVNIDTTIYSQANGDSVAALIGYSNGSLTVSNITVNGSIKALDGVGGIIGRSYNRDTGNKFTGLKTPFAYSVSGCTNNASVSTGTHADQDKGAGVIGFISSGVDNISITSCTNTGNVFGALDAGGIFVYGQSKTLTVTGCVNKGTISSNGHTPAYIGCKSGGAYISGSTIENNSNDGGSLVHNGQTLVYTDDNLVQK